MTDEPHTNIAREIDSLLQEIISREGVRLTPADLAMIVLCQIIRLRAVLTYAGASGLLQNMLDIAEDRLQSGNAFVDEDGNSINMTLAEERVELSEDEDGICPDTVPAEWT